MAEQEILPPSPRMRPTATAAVWTTLSRKIRLARRTLSCTCDALKLPRMTAALGGKVEIYAKRDDCNSGLAMGGNKLRKLE
jgi:hypothetical protein